jgi:hypothetical protein
LATFVIALVNPASASSPSTTYTYDPSGNPSMAGASTNWPFLYQGMEHENVDPTQFYYSGNGAYYSAQIMRSMSMTSAQGTSGPPGGPGPGPASLPSVGSSSPNAFDPGRRFQTAGEGLGVGASAALPVLSTGPESTVPALAVFVAAALSFDTASFLNDLFGGGGTDYPPNYFTFQHRLDRPHGGPHPLYTAFIGMPRGIVVDQNGPHGLCGDPHPCAKSPLVKDPQPQPEYRRAPKSARPEGKRSFSDCIASAATSQLIIFPIVCAGTTIGCLNAEVPGLNLLSCRVALATCTTTAAIVAACAAGTELPQ